MSKNMPKTYWKAPPAPSRGSLPAERVKSEMEELHENIPQGMKRRSFLKAAGFTLATSVAAGCSKPGPTSLRPYLNQPEGMVAGKPVFYASVCGACEAGCGTLVKSRDGRPIKLEGNPDHPLSRGGLCAVGQASLLGLYDSKRFAGPRIRGQETSWEEVDRALGEQLERVRKSGKAVRFLTGTVISPTTQAVIDRFLESFSDGRHVVYDPLSSSAILDAYEKTHGMAVLPRYRFEKADVIVSLDADFLGTWISPVEFAAAYRAARNLESDPPRMSYHVQFESRMSLTGTKADRRYRVSPAELPRILNALAARIIDKGGARVRTAEAGGVSVSGDELDDLAEKLWNFRGRSLVVSGSQDVRVQTVCAFLNHLLGNEGKTVDLQQPSFQRRGRDSDLSQLADEIRSGKVGALFIAGVNPVYDVPQVSATGKAPDVMVSFAIRPDETTEVVQFVCPDHHPLESWFDAEPVSGVVSIGQPVIRSLRNSRSMIESLNIWMGSPQSAYETIRKHWQSEIYPHRREASLSFRRFWDQTLLRGVAEISVPPMPVKPFQMESIPELPRYSEPEDGYFLVLYPKVGLRDGRHAYNPWLQELPDPVTKVTWDNYACLSVKTAAELGVTEGDIVRVEAEGGSLELPVYIQPAQHDEVVAVAIGYGQKITERFAGIGPSWLQGKPTVGEDGRIGKNVMGWTNRITNRFEPWVQSGVKVVKTGGTYPLASTQTHHTITVPEDLAPPDGSLRRPVLFETTLEEFLQNPESGKVHHHQLKELYPTDHEYKGHHWGMVIDPTACTGCSACVIACQAENNIPIVGKDEVRWRREMHWIRIDRYYSGDGDDVEVAHQPMLCQHCDQASCENVCPVLATVHTEEGLNAQVYNRCVGTRYCANNCAYKVRRFNWFNYRRDDELENMVLNPDVTVRMRGVMEKCSFCVQRLQEAKIRAAQTGGKVTDEAVRPACQQSCPSDAIVLGDMNDPDSRIAKLLKNPRYYKVLEELNTRPSVGYLTLVRNRPPRGNTQENHVKQEGRHES